MSNKKYILFTNNAFGVQERHFSVKHIVSILVVVVVLLSISFYGMSKILYQYFDSNSETENNNLITSIGLLQEKVDDLNLKIKDINEKDKAIRLYSGLPETDITIDDIGIGGRIDELYVGDEDTENFAKLTDLNKSLTQISKEVQLELVRYEKLAKVLKKNTEELKYTPTISPLRVNARISASYGMRIHPITHRYAKHDGIDFSTKIGTPIYATADGKVRYAKYVPGYGYTIKINHGYGYATYYAHLSKYKAKRGEKVKRGDLIGFTGNTGRSTGPHLHYEIRYNNRSINPKKYIFVQGKL